LNVPPSAKPARLFQPIEPVNANIRSEREGNGSSGPTVAVVAVAAGEVASLFELAASVELVDSASLSTTGSLGASVASGWAGAGASVVAGWLVAGWLALVSGNACVGATVGVVWATASVALVLTSVPAMRPNHKPGVVLFKRALLILKFFTMPSVLPWLELRVRVNWCGVSPR
jgi:hypothetical protein